MMAANFTVVDRKDCQQKYEKIRFISGEVFCAGDAETSLKTGDSDDPAVQKIDGKDTVVGVGSFSPKSEDFPSVFTRVGSYVTWILGIINKTQSL